VNDAEKAAEAYAYKEVDESMLKEFERCKRDFLAGAKWMSNYIVYELQVRELERNAEAEREKRLRSESEQS
jgi:hypothetical protein